MLSPVTGGRDVPQVTQTLFVENAAAYLTEEAVDLSESEAIRNAVDKVWVSVASRVSGEHKPNASQQLDGRQTINLPLVPPS